MINAISKHDARTAFDRIFTDTDPFKPAIRNDVAIRTILYPTVPYFLSAGQYQALTNALSSSRHAEFYVLQTEIDAMSSGSLVESGQWLVKDLSYEEYLKLDLFVENALISADGEWGILLSHESHAVFASSKRFWDSFSARYDNSGDKKAFIGLWENLSKTRGVDISWLAGLLSSLTV